MDWAVPPPPIDAGEKGEGVAQAAATPAAAAPVVTEKKEGKKATKKPMTAEDAKQKEIDELAPFLSEDEVAFLREHKDVVNIFSYEYREISMLILKLPNEFSKGVENGSIFLLRYIIPYLILFSPVFITLFERRILLYTVLLLLIVLNCWIFFELSLLKRGEFYKINPPDLIAVFMNALFLFIFLCVAFLSFWARALSMLGEFGKKIRG